MSSLSRDKRQDLLNEALVRWGWTRYLVQAQRKNHGVMSGYIDIALTRADSPVRAQSEPGFLCQDKQLKVFFFVCFFSQSACLSSRFVWRSRLFGLWVFTALYLMHSSPLSITLTNLTNINYLFYYRIIFCCFRSGCVDEYFHLLGGTRLRLLSSCCVRFFFLFLWNNYVLN